MGLSFCFHRLCFYSRQCFEGLDYRIEVIIQTSLKLPPSNSFLHVPLIKDCFDILNFLEDF